MGAPLTPAKFIKGVYERGHKRGREAVSKIKGFRVTESIGIQFMI
jgi:hypothetical protein